MSDKEQHTWLKGYWDMSPPPELTSGKVVQNLYHPDLDIKAVVGRRAAGIAMPLRTEKWWGEELTYYNKDYCMKMLRFDWGGHTSMHFHLKKHETLLVIHGVLTLEVIVNKEEQVYRLGPGTAWVVPQGHMHRLIAAEGDVTLMEASTTDLPTDSVRVYS